MGIKDLLIEQLSEYQENYNGLEKECIHYLKEKKPFILWEEKAKKASGLKLMIEHCQAEILRLS